MITNPHEYAKGTDVHKLKQPLNHQTVGTVGSVLDFKTKQPEFGTILKILLHVTNLFKLMFYLVLTTKFCGTIFMLYALLESIDLMLLKLATHG